MKDFRGDCWMKKNSKILKYAAILLITLYAVSFLPGVRRDNSEKYIQSSLMNKKYENMLLEITISEKNNSVRLYRRNTADVWEGECNRTVFPVDNKQIQTFITRLTKIRNMYKISDNKKRWSYFFLVDQSAVTVVYKINENMSTKLYFGGQNFTKTRRYIRSGNNVSSYEIDSDLDFFLTTKTSFWYDPYIIPQNVTASLSEYNIQSVRANGILYTQKSIDFKEKSRRLSELRHGEITTVPQNEKSVYTFEIESGDGINISIQTYEADEGKILAYTFTNTLDGRKYDYTYAVMVSNWTFCRIEELFPPLRQ
jgi:hypothetical protein